MSSYAESIFAYAMALAASGKFSTISQVQIELRTKYPDAHLLIFREEYRSELADLHAVLRGRAAVRGENLWAVTKKATGFR